MPAGVAAGRQRGTEIGVAFTRWLAETSNFIIRYAMALFLANTQESLGKVGTALDPQIDEVEQWMLDTWAADNARLEAGNFTSYELEMITGWRKTGAIGGFVAGQAIGPAIGETSGAIWGSVGSAMATAAVNGLRTYLDASNTTSSSSLPLPAASRRLLQSLLDDALTTEALEALIQGLFDFDEGGGDEGASQKEDAGPTEQRREDKPKRKAQSLAARVGMSPAAIAGWGVFAGEVTNTAPLMANAIAGWTATSIVIGASAGIGAGVANGVAWGIGREIGYVWRGVAWLGIGAGWLGWLGWYSIQFHPPLPSPAHKTRRLRLLCRLYRQRAHQCAGHAAAVHRIFEPVLVDYLRHRPGIRFRPGVRICMVHGGKGRRAC